jgi:O-antigen/teichoic acid export membrane protein
MNEADWSEVQVDTLRPVVAPEGRSAQGRRATAIVLSFLLGQGPLQLVQILSGFLLVRWLSVEAWAQYGLASGLQLTMGILMDLGIAGTIIPLVGHRRDDPGIIGRYVRAAKNFRDWTFWVLAPVTVAGFLILCHRHGWGWKVETLLVLAVLLTLYSNGQMSCFSAPLLIFGRLQDFYVPQTLSGTVRVAAYAVCRVFGALNSWTAAMLLALNVSANASLLKRKSRKYLELPAHSDPETDREMLRYMLPATPAVVFAAFQSQIALFLISLFGQTANIAEVAALGKLGQLFAVLMTFNVVVIEPYVARLSRERLLSTYLGFTLITSVVCIPVVLAAFAFPKPFLWLLGGNYAGLSQSVGWVVFAACGNHVAGMMWIMNRARKWVFWSGTILEIVLLLLVQTAFIALVGVQTTRHAVLFCVASSFCYIVAHGYVGIYGFYKGHTEVRASDVVPPPPNPIPE